ncbi:hypothetical protein [Modestobacter excelsi]|uniref:hypothetical protein n=1 Tax=Modestobacter excelsi TaxID=2213161 RepID=UPI001C20E302|nr:hypothetical protein [Modestobacter excelsi]
MATPARPPAAPAAAPGEPGAGPRRPTPRDVPKRTPLVARPVGATGPDTDAGSELPHP